MGELKERLAASLADLSPDGVLAISLEGRILYCTPGAEAVFGYAAEEAEGRSIFDLIVPADHVEETREGMRAAADQGLAVFESVRRRKDGSQIYIVAAQKAVRDAHGNLEFLLCSSRNITEVKTRREIRSLAARFGELLQAAPDALVMVNRVGLIVLVNRLAEAMLGYPEEELLGRPVELLVPERYRDVHVHHRSGYFSSPSVRPMGTGLELFALHKDGTGVPVEISLSPVQTDDGTVTVATVRILPQRLWLEEIRRRSIELEAQYQRIQEANQQKSEFVAGMSHELRTPLNAIIGFAELLRDEKAGPLNAEQKEYLEDVLTSGHHLLRLIDDVLDLAKVESGAVQFRPEPVNVERLAGKVRDIFRPLSAHKRITVEVEVGPDLGPVALDPTRLTQVFYNFLANALKFTPDEGHVKIRVRPEDEAHMRIEVEDTGIGIRPEDLPRLFVGFQQLEGPAGSEGTGTGLGLAITKRIVESQGGSVGVWSTAGKGSTFYAVLPRIYPRDGSGA